jgi:hypothetical protein
MMLVSRTYGAGIPSWFRTPPEVATVESLALRAQHVVVPWIQEHLA